MKYEKIKETAPNSSCRKCHGRGLIYGNFYMLRAIKMGKFYYGWKEMEAKCRCVKKRLVRKYEDEKIDRELNPWRYELIEFDEWNKEVAEFNKSREEKTKTEKESVPSPS